MRRLDLVDLGLQGLLLFIELRVLRPIRGGFGLVKQRPVDLDIPEDRCLHAVVVLLQDRVELVVVTPGAVHGHPKHATPQGRKHVIEIVMPAFRVVLFPESDPWTHTVEAGSDQPVKSDFVQFIAGQLF